MSLRIAFVLPHFDVGGAEHVVLRLLTHLDRAQFQPVLVLQDRRGALLDHVPTDVQVLDLGGLRASRAVLSLARLLRRQNFDLTYTLTNAANLMLLAALRLSGTRTRAVVSEHTPLSGFLPAAKATGLRTQMMRWLYPSAAALVAPLPQIGTEHCDILNGRTPPFSCLPNPVIDALPTMGPSRRKDVPTRLVSLGRLAPEKRFDLMIEAFAIAHRSCPQLQLTIHGEGPCRPDLTRQIAQHGLQEAVFLPGLTHSVTDVLSQGDLFLCTSRLEGLGNAIIEAMAAGLPVMSVDCPYGPPVLLEGGQTGALVCSDQPEEIAAELLRLRADGPRLDTYRSRGRKMAARYTTKDAVSAYETLFASA